MNNTPQIEQYVLGPFTADTVVTEAQLLLDKELREKVLWQQKTYALVQEYGRKKLRAEIEQVHRELFTQEKHLSFRQKVMRWFGI